MNAPGGIPIRRALIEAPLEFRLRSGGTQSSGALITCPKCDAPCYIRRSERITPIVKHLTAHCTNSGCGHIFEAEVVATRTLVPGLLQREGVNLPVVPADQVPHVLPPSREGPGEENQISMFGTAAGP